MISLGSSCTEYLLTNSHFPMTPDNRTRNISLLLTFVAGYCDTVTFVAADEVFSAHVTGNFIVLAYDVVNQTDAEA